MKSQLGDSMKTRSFSIILNVVLAVALIVVSYLYGNAAQHIAIDNIQHQTVADVDRFIERNQPALDSATRRGYAEFMVEAADHYNVPPRLLAAIGLMESSFRSGATGDGGRTHGLMQVQDLWIGHIPFIQSRADLYEPDKAIRAAAWILRAYSDDCDDGSWYSMLARYNGGRSGSVASHRYAANVLRIALEAK